MLKFVRTSLIYFLALHLALAPSLIQAGSVTESSPAPSSDDSSALRTEIANLESALEGRFLRHPLDTFRLLDQRVYDVPRPHRIDDAALHIKVRELGGATVRAELGRRVGDVWSGPTGDGASFELFFQNQRIMEFRAPVRAVTFFDGFLVFVEESGWIADRQVQNVSFVDLEYFKPALGRTALPVFRVPIKVENRASAPALSIRNGHLSVFGEQVTGQVFQIFSDIQQAAFNASVALVDSKSLERMAPLAEGFREYFEKALSLRGADAEAQVLRAAGSEETLQAFQEKLLKEFESKKNRGERQDLTKLPEDLRQFFEKALPIEETARSIQQNVFAQRRLMARLQHLSQAMILPQPTGAPRLVEAMALVVSAAKPKNENRWSDLREGLLRVGGNPSMQMGLAIATGLFLGSQFPDAVGGFFYQGLDITRSIFDVALGKASDSFYLLKEATYATFVGFNPVEFSKAYLAPDRLPKVGVGLSAIFTTLYLTLGVPHIIANTAHLVRDLRAMDWTAMRKAEAGWWGTVRSALIQRQQKLLDDYLANLSDAEAKLHGKNHENFTSEEELEVDRIIREKEQERLGSRTSQFLLRLHLAKSYGHGDSVNGPKIESLRQALMHFLFSYEALTVAARSYTQLWNSWFALRSFLWHPSVAAAYVAYPNFYGRAVSGRIPNQINGGTRNRWEQIRLRFQKATDDQYKNRLKEVEAWEARYAQVESLIQKQVFRKTMDALVRFVPEMPSLKTFFENGGADRIADRSLDQLTSEQRRFFRAYFEAFSDDAMVAYLRDAVASRTGPEAEHPLDMDTLKSGPLPDVSEEDVRRYLDRVDSEGVYRSARESAARPLAVGTIVQNMKADIVRTLDPENNLQVKRIQSVNRQMENPKAMARAVRSMVASNLVDKPLELFFTFVCMAGITAGVLAPIQDQMFGSNSWFYLSRMVFTNGFIYGVLSGVLADTWMKLQQDEMNEGSFDSVPKDKDAAGGFKKYFFKILLKDDRTSLWRSQKHYIRIIWANMKAALTTTVLVNLVTLGRFDLDSYIIGYLFSYVSPTSGFAFKVEQSFELASSYFAKDFPEHLRAHPKAQAYINWLIARKRLWFNLYYKIYENVIGYLMLNYEQMTTPKLGSRSFSRILFGGHTPTELSVKAIDWVEAKAGWVPGVEPAAKACRLLFSKGYTDFAQPKGK